MTIIVVPDSNGLYADPFLERALARTILAAEDYADVRLMLPEVVIDELRGQVIRSLDALVRTTDGATREFDRLSGSFNLMPRFHFTQEERSAVVQRFEERRDYFGRDMRLLAYPSASSSDLRGIFYASQDLSVL